MSDGHEDSMTLEGKYLTFHLGEEEYGISILKIREIIGMMAITAMPQAPVFLKGVINLRGRVIPVVDLRILFEMQEAEYSARTCIIVVETGGETVRPMTTGLVVDAVSEVQNIRAGEIEPPPALGAGPESGYLLGMAKSNGEVKILLDIDAVLGDQKTAMTREVA